MENLISPIVQGRVLLRKNNEIVVNTHNMILRDGRMIIINKLFGNAPGLSNTDQSVNPLQSYSNYTFSGIIFYYDKNSSSMTYKYDVDNEFENSQLKFDSGALWLSNNGGYRFELNTANNAQNIPPYLTLKVEYNVTASDISSATEFNSLGIVFSNGNTKKLFSRAQFDSLVLKSGDNLALDYALYF